MNANNSGDYEEEKIVLELVGLDNISFEENTQYELVGLNTPTPFLKIGNMIFKGFFEECVGTNLIFDKEKLEEDNKQSYYAHGTKKIVFQRVILEQKNTNDDGNGNSKEGAPITIDEHIHIIDDNTH